MNAFISLSTVTLQQNICQQSTTRRLSTATSNSLSGRVITEEAVLQDLEE